MLQTFEAAVREVAFWAVLTTGCLCLIGGSVVLAGWAGRKLLTAVGLYKDFLAFVRARKRGR